MTQIEKFTTTHWEKFASFAVGTNEIISNYINEQFKQIIAINDGTIVLLCIDKFNSNRPTSAIECRYQHIGSIWIYHDCISLSLNKMRYTQNDFGACYHYYNICDPNSFIYIEQTLNDHIILIEELIAKGVPWTTFGNQYKYRMND